MNEAQEQNMAVALRTMGWTCTPPEREQDDVEGWEARAAAIRAERIATYGLCSRCGEPRGVRRTEVTAPGGSAVLYEATHDVTSTIVCPNGCYQGDDPPADRPDVSIDCPVHGHRPGPFCVLCWLASPFGTPPT